MTSVEFDGSSIIRYTEEIVSESIPYDWCHNIYYDGPGTLLETDIVMCKLHSHCKKDYQGDDCFDRVFKTLCYNMHVT